MSDNIEIIPLGTISPYPKGERNNPVYLLKYKDYKFLLDCGNGTTRLLDFNKDLENLNVFITHFHLDHFADLAAIQYGSYCYHNLGLLNNKVNIYLPDNNMNNFNDIIRSSKEVYADYHEISNDKKYKFDELNISFEDNNSHSIPSYMIKLELPDKKIIYTSDIGISNFASLVDFCSKADLIICESSFLEKHKSRISTHLTAKDAATLAKKSNSKRLLLTHLWPEEDRNEYLKEAQQIFENTEVAEEGKKLILRR